MRILIVKTSSLGDVIHTLPALTDVQQHFPDVTFDWVLEPAFAEIPRFHQTVKKIIPVALRRWRKNIFQTIKNQEWKNFYAQLREEKYDLVIDAQGLIKSSFITMFTRGTRCGYDKHSAWEPLACFAYQQKFAVDPQQHAITRIRQLFAQCLNYAIPEETPDYGITIEAQNLSSLYPGKNYIVLLHGTTREDKYWPESHWIKLIELLKTKDLIFLLPWGSEKEKNRAERLAAIHPQAKVLPNLSLTELAALLKNSKINISVDSGLGHLSAALNAPTIALYGPTDPALIGTVGQHQIHLRASKMPDIFPENVADLIKPYWKN